MLLEAIKRTCIPSVFGWPWVTAENILAAMPRFSMLLLMMAAAWIRPAGAQEPPLSNAQLARETSDPTSNVWYLFTEGALGFSPGEPFQESDRMTLEFQPSLPVSLTRSWRWLNLPDLVLATQGTPDGTQVSGLQSFSWVAALSPAGPPLGFSWGAGPYVSFPVSTEEALGPSQWQFGPGGILSYRTENLVASAIVKAGWATSDQAAEAGSLQFQYNLQHFFGDGYQVGLGRPRIEYTWDRGGAGRWDVPIGVDVARMFRIGSLPVKIMLEYDFFVLNDSRWNPEHLFRITILPVLTSPQNAPLFGD